MSQFGKPEPFVEHANTIRCPGCGKIGTVTWEDFPAGHQEWVQISHGFYERLCKKAPYHIELVCEDCGVPQKLSPES